MNTIPCLRCRALLEAPPEEERFDSVPLCPTCRPLYPHSLIKAVLDPFDYALALSTGERFRFASAQIDGHFIHLEELIEREGALYPLPRGVDVRLEDIIWCADAPIGS